MEQNRPVVSIIVPIFRIAAYLGFCIESILCQTYSDLEVILVDDGSDDRCPELCDLYQRKDSRISVIHKPNGGLVSARKAGIEIAHGEYIGFVDGDDWLDDDFVETMLTNALDTGADVVCGGYKRDLFRKSVCLLNPYPTGVYRGKELDTLKENMISFGEFYSPGITTYVWNKLFKRELLLPAQMGVDEGITLGEDAAVTYPALMEAQCVSVCGCTSYHYRQREDSMLKRSVSFSADSEHLRRLYRYLISIAEKNGDRFGLRSQITDYVLGLYLMRSGGKTSVKGSAFDERYYGQRVAVYSAGTFGQQLVNRIRESGHCTVVKWIDDDYWEYRRSCLDVDAVESINDVSYDYVLIATIDGRLAESIKQRLVALEVDAESILSLECPPDRRAPMLEQYLNMVW